MIELLPRLMGAFSRGCRISMLSRSLPDSSLVNSRSCSVVHLYLCSVTWSYVHAHLLVSNNVICIDFFSWTCTISGYSTAPDILLVLLLPRKQAENTTVKEYFKADQLMVRTSPEHNRTDIFGQGVFQGGPARDWMCAVTEKPRIR